MKILGIGTTVVDQLVLLNTFPEPDTKSEICRSQLQVGGPVPVALSTAAALGSETRLLSRWGRDSDGQFIQRTLSSRSIDLQFVQSQPDWQSGNAQVWLSQHDGSRTIAFCRGRFPALSASDVSEPLLRGCHILHLDGWASEAAIPAAIKMKQQGGTVVLDAGSVKPGLPDLLPHVDVLIASKLFRNAFCNSGKNSGNNSGPQLSSSTSQEATSEKSNSQNPTSAYGVPTVITTNGEDGASLYDGDQVHHVKGHSVTVVDSNGAGDVFSGAVLFGLSQRWPMIQIVEFANRTAAESCTRFGNAASSLPGNVTDRKMAGPPN